MVITRMISAVHVKVWLQYKQGHVYSIPLICLSLQELRDNSMPQQPPLVDVALEIKPQLLGIHYPSHILIFS